ncbi:hypothetical protein, partial [Brevundimonas sp.]|uniref:hypothetical protein n=1 Tax=Brevundimonas sp. TaxID=1871086 RepID=UPI0025BA685B
PRFSPGISCRPAGKTAKHAGREAWLRQSTVVISTVWPFVEIATVGPPIASWVPEQNALDGQNDGRTP